VAAVVRFGPRASARALAHPRETGAHHPLGGAHPGEGHGSADVVLHDRLAVPVSLGPGNTLRGGVVLEVSASYPPPAKLCPSGRHEDVKLVLILGAPPVAKNGISSDGIRGKKGGEKMAESAVRFLRVIHGLEEIRLRTFRRGNLQRSINEDIFQQYKAEGRLYELENVSGTRELERLHSILDTCFACVEGSFDSEPTGFWKEAMELFQKEGLDAGAFLTEFRRRVKEHSEPSRCYVLTNRAVFDWIAENI